MNKAPVLLLALAALTAAQEGGGQGEDEEIVVTALGPAGDIIVGAPAHCYRDRSDPMNLFKVVRGKTEQSMIIADETGRLARRPDYDAVQGPRVWQRAGNAIGDYRFRSRDGEGPVCIGSLVPRPEGYAQLRKMVSAEGMHGRYLRFSAAVATRKAAQVHFWIAAADGRRAFGGDTRTKPIRGTNDWQRFDLVIGPVPRYARHISYGLLLHGRGDVWLRDEKLETLTREEARGVAALPISSVARSTVPRKP